MTSLSHRKRPTTVPRTRVRTACRLALLLALAGGPAVAQYPGRQSQSASALAPAGVRPQDKKSEEKTLAQKEQEDRDRYVRLPNREVVFAFPDDAQLERAIIDRIWSDIKAKKDFDPTMKKELEFPRYAPVGAGQAFRSKTADYPPARVNYDALFVVHRRLHFEELNAERYGWDLGIIQPLVSAAYFYKDVLLWPNSLASGCAYGFWDTSAGKCLPGSPTPYMLYPPGLTITGTAFEGVIITGAAFAIP